MSVRRLRPLAESTRRLSLELKRCEARIALLDRVRPLNWAAEVSRLGLAFVRGARPDPAFEHGPLASFPDLRRLLADSMRTLEHEEPEAQLLCARAAELDLEASMAEQIGTARFAELAKQRFPLSLDAAGTHLLAQQLLTTSLGPSDNSGGRTHVSDDAHDPDSLWSKISRRIAAERWPVRVEVVPGLVSLAAVADGVVRVRPGARLTARSAERTAVHEVEGHVRPRVMAHALGGAFVAGTTRASEDEEGRAILLEERAGLLDPERRKELARRYLAAESVRGGAKLWDTVELLGRTGATAPAAIELSCRVHRGGGLGRELLYLTGYARVSAALAKRPELERVLQSGRISLAAAEILLNGSIELDDDGDVI